MTSSRLAFATFLLLAFGAATIADNQVACYGIKTRTDAYGVEGGQPVCYAVCNSWTSCTGQRTYRGPATPALTTIFCSKKSTPTQDQNGNTVCVGGQSGLFNVSVEECPVGTITCPPGDPT